MQRTSCDLCCGMGVIGVRTCGHRGNCPCAFDLTECVCAVRERAQQAVMQEVAECTDAAKRADLLETHAEIADGDHDGTLEQMVAYYRTRQRERRRTNFEDGRNAMAAHRCSTTDGCDVTTIQRYAVTDHEGHVHVCEYCQECADLARADWNGETASIVGPITDLHCAGCSAVLGEPVDRSACSTLTHPMGELTAHAQDRTDV